MSEVSKEAQQLVDEGFFDWLDVPYAEKLERAIKYLRRMALYKEAKKNDPDGLPTLF